MLQDFNEPAAVEIVVDKRGYVWINVNGGCVMRAKNATYITVDIENKPRHAQGDQPKAIEQIMELEERE